MLEGIRETKLLSIKITLDKFPDLVFKLYVDPTTTNLVLIEWNWSLISALADFKLSSHCDFPKIYQGTFECVNCLVSRLDISWVTISVKDV